MGYPRDLLHAAWVISHSQDEVFLRRAVSTAYYALFHLLIQDACSDWPNPEQRARLSRQFSHGRMKDASEATARRSPVGSDLFVVSNTFVHLQGRRHQADYDLEAKFSSLDVVVDLSAAELSFVSWERVRKEAAAREYLFSLLFKDRG